MTRVCMIALVLVPLGPVCQAQDQAAPTIVIDFEAGLPDGADVQGDGRIVEEPVHAGQRALRVEPGAMVAIPVSERPAFGTVNVWYYEAGTQLEDEKQYAFGPLVGLRDPDGGDVVYGRIHARYLAGNTGYGYINAVTGDWFSRQWAGGQVQEGWRNWTFTVLRDGGMEVKLDEQVATNGLLGFEVGHGDDRYAVLLTDGAGVPFVGERHTDATVCILGEHGTEESALVLAGGTELMSEPGYGWRFSQRVNCLLTFDGDSADVTVSAPRGQPVGEARVVWKRAPGPLRKPVTSVVVNGEERDFTEDGDTTEFTAPLPTWREVLP